MIHRRLPVIAIACALATTASAGIFEGNPPKLHVHLWAVPASTSTGRAHVSPSGVSVTAWLQEVRWMGCDGEEFTVIVDEGVDLTHGFELDVPRGRWCALEPDLLDLEVTDTGDVALPADMVGTLSLPLSGSALARVSFSARQAPGGELLFVTDFSDAATADE